MFFSRSKLATSAILGVGGVIALSKSKFDKQAMFAAIPLIFSIQRLCEGFLWKAIHSDTLTGQHLNTHLFLVFAQVVWSTWLPLSILKTEEDPKRKRVLRYILFAGILTSLMLGLRMLFSTITSRADDY